MVITSHTARMNQWFKYAALAAILATFFGYFCTAIWDMDFWWHIATGRHIVETLSIPEQDPFAMYSADSLRSDLVLKGNWLAQVVLFYIFDAWGANGIILLKAGVLMLCLAVIFIRSMLIGAGGMSTLLVLGCTGMMLLHFTGDRPQIFSFLFFSLAILLLDMAQAKNKTWPLYLLPALMMIWANSHGGVVLGGVLLVLLAMIHAAQAYFSGHFLQPKWLFVFLIVAVVFTFISPNGIGTYLALVEFQLSDGELRNRTSEFMSPVTLLGETRMMLPFYWGFVLLAAVTLPKFFKKTNVAPALITLVLGGLSLTAFRYIPFFMLYAAPYVALGMMQLTPFKIPARTFYGGVAGAALVILGYGIDKNRAFQQGIRPNHFPQGAVSFIKQNGLTGKIFNAFSWGGYLTWNLYPHGKAFIDGRVLDKQPFRDYTHILWATPYGIRQLDNYKFDYVLIQYANAFTGEEYKLNNYLLHNPEWQVIYRDQSGFLFARRGSSG